MEFGLNFQSQYEFMFVKREDLLDPLMQQATNNSYEKFASTLQALHNHKLNPVEIHSTFIALHGFVLCYKGRVGSYEEGKEAALNHAEYLLKALVR